MKMTKIIILFIFIFVSNSNLYATSFSWKYIASTIDSDTDFFIDDSTIKEIGDLHFFWSLADYLRLDDQDDKHVRSVTNFNVIKCESFEFKVISYTSYRALQAKGGIYSNMLVKDISPDLAVWEKIDPSSTFGAVMEYVCDY